MRLPPAARQLPGTTNSYYTNTHTRGNTLRETQLLSSNTENTLRNYYYYFLNNLK